MRRRPEDRYQSAGEMLGFLANLDLVDTTPGVGLADPPMRGVAMGANAHVWQLIGLVAACYVGLAGGIIAATVVLR
jgi:hypothetical protein